MPLYTEHRMRQEDSRPVVLSNAVHNYTTYGGYVYLKPTDKMVLVSTGATDHIKIKLPTLAEVPDDAPYLCIYLVNRDTKDVEITNWDDQRLTAINVTLSATDDFYLVKKTALGWIRIQERVAGAAIAPA